MRTLDDYGSSIWAEKLFRYLLAAGCIVDLTVWCRELTQAAAVGVVQVESWFPWRWRFAPGEPQESGAPRV